MTESTRNVRSRARIDLMVEAAIVFAQKYPGLSVNTIAVALDWTQSSLNRALDSRDMQMPENGGRKSISELVYEAAMVDDGYATLEALKADIQALKDSTTVELPEPEPEVTEETETEEAEEAEVDFDEDDEDEDYSDDI